MAVAADGNHRVLGAASHAAQGRFRQPGSAAIDTLAQIDAFAARYAQMLAAAEEQEGEAQANAFLTKVMQGTGDKYGRK